MKVKMNKHTRWNSKALFPGDTVEIDSTTAHRWVEKKIASLIKTERADTKHAPTPASAAADEQYTRGELSKMKYNDLRKLAALRGIKFPRSTKKEALINMLVPEAAEPESGDTRRDATQRTDKKKE